MNPKSIYNDIAIDHNKFEVVINNHVMYLTHLEFKVLLYLIQNGHRAVSRDELLSEIWQLPSSIETRATDDIVKRLRRKLRSCHSTTQIDTIRGFGFILSKPADAEPETAFTDETQLIHHIRETIDTLKQSHENSHTVTFIDEDQHIIQFDIHVNQ